MMFPNPYNKPLEIGDIINAMALIIGLQNLEENREQSQYNDVKRENDKQAKYLLYEIKSQFEKQNKILEQQSEMLKEILSRLSDEKL